MRRNSPITDWFFPIEKAPVLGNVTRNEEARNVTVPHKKELADADTWDWLFYSPIPFLKTSAIPGGEPERRSRK